MFTFSKRKPIVIVFNVCAKHVDVEIKVLAMQLSKLTLLLRGLYALRSDCFVLHVSQVVVVLQKGF